MDWNQFDMERLVNDFFEINIMDFGRRQHKHRPISSGVTSANIIFGLLWSLYYRIQAQSDLARLGNDV